MASTTDWKQLPDSVVDPITLEPINELRVEPFKINQLTNKVDSAINC